MDTPAQAAAYAHADFTEPHSQFIKKFQEVFPVFNITGKVLDLGCGPADVSIRFARAFPECRIDGVDGAVAMLAEGRRLVNAAGLEHRIQLLQGRIPGFIPPEKTYRTIISNSLLHHLHDPLVLWRYVQRYQEPNARLFFMDLKRPDNQEEVNLLVNTYCHSEPKILKDDFRNSLCAAFTPEEVRRQLAEAKLTGLTVEIISDRHIMIHSN